jgi:hypothetical protein
MSPTMYTIKIAISGLNRQVRTKHLSSEPHFRNNWWKLLKAVGGKKLRISV